MVWVGPVGTGSDDCEVDLFMTELSQQSSKISRNLSLAPTRETSLHDLAVRRVGRFPSSREAHQFVAVLDCTHHRKALGQRPITRPWQRSLQPEKMHRPR
jgi:hypothetical protein